MNKRLIKGKEMNKVVLLPPIPDRENERLKALNEYNLLDTIPEEQFDRLTKLAAIICESPIALISLVDKDRQWFKSKVGLEVDETARDISFCQYSIMGDDFFEVEDATKDARFKKNPLVLGDPNIRFYAAYPLIDPDGYALGSLCIIDRAPKKLNAFQKEALKTLSEDIMLQIVNNKKNDERKKLEKFFVMSTDLICIAGLDGLFKRVNPAFRQTLGWSEEEMVNKPFLDFVHPDDKEKTLLELENLKTGKNTMDFINRYRTKSNTYRIFQWVASADINTGEIFAIARDNTLLKKIKAEIEASATAIEQLNTALNESAIVSVSDPNGKIEFVNEAFCSVSKYKREELIGNDHRILNSGFHSKEFIADIWDTLQNGKIWKGEIKNKCKDGTFFWVETTIVPFLDMDKKPLRYVSIRYDVTDRVQLESALRKSKDEIEKTAKIKEQFLANMSHEIRTPLNAIIGFSEILRSSKLTPKQEEHAKIITRSGENLMGIINDILDFTKIEGGNVTLEKVPLSIVDINDSVKKMFLKIAEEKQIELKVFSEIDIPACVNGDPVRITQILVNLVGNAIKFTKSGSVRIYTTIVSQTPDTFMLEYRIEDSGIGIPSDKLEVIFDRFVQAEDNTTRKFGGTGLGLSIVKNLVKLMSGEISVKSEFNKGAEFRVLIPLQKSTDSQIDEYKNQQKKIEYTHIKNMGELSILLVEDNRMNQQYVSTLMQQLDIHCDIADSGLMAINMLTENTYDLILMDIQMPEMDGYEATGIIRKEMKIEIPIIALTANATATDHEKCLKCGMNAYISKPFKPKDLYDKIAEITVGKTRVDSTNLNGSKSDVKQLNVNYFQLSHLKEQVNGNMKVVKQLIDIFMEDIPRDFILLEKAISSVDYRSIESISHQLVSTFSIIGIAPAIKLLKAMEQKARENKEILVIKEMNNGLKTITEKVRIELEPVCLSLTKIN